eukprot:scaffold934_cov191-Alexandrium_tamarense.AAC.19
MASDDLFPDSVKDFVFDLHDVSRRSFIPSEQHSLYVGSFRDVTAKGWHTYRQLFDLLLSEAPEEEGGADAEKKKKESLYLVPEWCFDILHEFLYQFQGFCQFRTTTYCAAAKFSSDNDGENKAIPSHVADAIDALNSNRDAWAVETVLYYLHRLVAVGSGSNASATYRYLAILSLVTISRLECLLGDYKAAISALDVVYNDHDTKVPVGEEMKSAEELVNGVFPARLSLAYHAGVSYLMLRRYKDAVGTGQLRKIPGSEQFNKLFDRMIALLAILTHICPTAILDDSIASIVRDKHANNLSKIESGEEGYEDLFVFACPKFVNAAVPDYAQALKPGAEMMPYGQDAYKLQVHHFMNEMTAHQTLRKMRSYMSLYTSIGVEKLASFNDMKVEEFEPWLTCFKHKVRQLERGEGGDKMGTAMDIHYYVGENLVHVDEAEKVRRFETFFMKQIANNDDILRQVERLRMDV